jgi:molecular chaperone GrpE
MSRRRLDQVLARYGAERIDATGTCFDPSLHDAVTTVTVNDPAQDKKVLAQLAPGYRFRDRLLRPAKVVVGVYPS